MKKLLLLLLLVSLIVALIAFFRVPVPPSGPISPTLARASVAFKLSSEFEPKTTGGILSWLGVRGPSRQLRPEVGTKFASITSTGFASSPYQTDSSPCRTAAGTWPRPGTVASNFLPLGTLLAIIVDGVKVPGLFIVEDRMADRFNSRIDIWFASTSQALDFGKRRVEIIVIGYGKPGQSLAAVEEKETNTVLAVGGAWEGFKARARAVAEFLKTQGTGVNRFDVDCLDIQRQELGV